MIFLVPFIVGPSRPRREMRHLDRLRKAWLFVTLAVLVAAWLLLSVVLIVTRGDPEALLTAWFGRLSRTDAFNGVNDVTLLVWCAHTCLTPTAIAASRWHRTDVIVILQVGPLIALAIALLGEQWDDPNWHVILSVCAIGWFVSTVVAGCFWILKGRWKLVPAQKARS